MSFPFILALIFVDFSLHQTSVVGELHPDILPDSIQPASSVPGFLRGLDLVAHIPSTFLTGRYLLADVDTSISIADTRPRLLVSGRLHIFLISFDSSLHCRRGGHG